jgi:hypothetical protein
VQDGKVIRTLTSKKIGDKDSDKGAYSERKPPEPLPADAGQHRITWDLRHKGAFTITGAKVDGGRPDLGPLVTPGEYTVRLTVDGVKHEQKLTVLKEPRLKDRISDDELEAQEKFALEVRDAITQLAIRAEELRGVRKQLLARDELLKEDDKAKKKLIPESKKLEEKLDKLEAKLHNPKAQVPYDILAMKGGAQLYSQLAWLYALAQDGDGAPTQGVRKMHVEHLKTLAEYEKQWAELKKKDLASLNDLAKKANLPIVVVPEIKPPATDGKPTETRKAKRFAK